MGKGETVGAFYPIPFGTLKLSFVTRAIVMLDYEKQDCRTIYEASVFDFFLFNFLFVYKDLFCLNLGSKIPFVASTVFLMFLLLLLHTNIYNFDWKFLSIL